MGYSPWDRKELDMTERPTHTHHHHAKLLELKIDQGFRIQLTIIAIIHIASLSFCPNLAYIINVNFSKMTHC